MCREWMLRWICSVSVIKKNPKDDEDRKKRIRAIDNGRGNAIGIIYKLSTKYVFLGCLVEIQLPYPKVVYGAAHVHQTLNREMLDAGNRRNLLEIPDYYCS